MLFNSGVFLKFFAAFLLLYWMVRNHLRARNILILIASYVFYGWWDYRFLSLLLFSCLVDFAVALRIEQTSVDSKRKRWLAVSLVSNFTILGFFKYYGFFVTSFSDLLQSVGVPVRFSALNIILPVGISFYTFQAISYTIDVYRRQLPASRDLINFLAYVAFFPQLVAGPIERATHLLPQFDRTLRITRVMIEEGIWLMIWGMFKKVVIADNIDPLVTMVYGKGATLTAATVILGTIAFGIQIYCDFSGYSDIARGTARVLGFDIMVNFNLPYAATSITDFWRRWHISLSTWLRDYLYISLGGNRRGTGRTYLNLLITMLLGGLWHGAAWNFVLWGLWHGVGLVVHRFFSGHYARKSKTFVPGELPALEKGTGTIRDAGPRPLWRWTTLLPWLATMLFVLYGWLLFRARSIEQIAAMTRALADFSAPVWLGSYVLTLTVFSLPLVAMELWQWRARSLDVPLQLGTWPRAILQGLLLLGILLFWERNVLPFQYFQF
jgi:D-alanyl-lipoteichoic acid acyltransferase DltB (MBOAT superfamily)